MKRRKIRFILAVFLLCLEFGATFVQAGQKQREQQEEETRQKLMEDMELGQMQDAVNQILKEDSFSTIITVTMSGFTANMIARYKPGCQIIGCTLDEKVYRQLNLLWGVKPVMIQKERTTDALFEEAVFKAKQAGLVKTGDTVVITACVPLGVVGKTDMIHVVEVE